MAQATVQRLTVPTAATQAANCTDCLTRDCPLVGALDYPVQRCNSYRQANCYLCGKSDCALNGALDSPVMACGQFVALAVA